MLNKLNFIILFLCFSAFVLNAADKTIAVEVTGISIIGENISKAKEKAFQDAFKKAIMKVSNDLYIVDNSTISDLSVNSPEKFIDGYEIVEETQHGNIFNEKLKVFVNVKALLKNAHKSYSEKPVYVLSTCIKDNVTFEIDKTCESIFRKNLTLIPNIIPVKTGVANNDLATLFNQPKDILVIVSYEITNRKRVYSIGKEFDNITFHIDIYDSENLLIKTFSKRIRLLASIDDNPVKNIPDNFFRQALNYISDKAIAISEKAQDKSEVSFYLVISKPENYICVKQVLNLLFKFNINYSLEKAENGSLFYRISGSTRKDVLKIIKFSHLKFYELKADNNIMLTLGR